jgi:radical SAM superfamily enzyme YgiQ (UPF0313 family)
MLDIILINVPGCVTQTPFAAPALLKASLLDNGFSCKTIDYNIKFYSEIQDYKELESYFIMGTNNYDKEASDLVEHWVKDLVKLNPKYIGISVFTYQNRIAAKLFCQHIKKLSNIKIILGGQGLADGGINGENTFSQELVQKKLIDYTIRSEGDISLVELLKGHTTYPGINSTSFSQIDDLNKLPFPNYDDYDFSLYESAILPIIGSRGCVRSCSFCDIHEHWKYRYRSGELIAQEMIYLAGKYNLYEFKFSDSLVNGNLKEFKKFISIIAEYNEISANPLKWSGQFIVRSSNQINEEYWKNIARSGGNNLLMGVETGSDSVRTHMNKNFTNADLDYTMEMLAKYNITCTFLMIFGYPTETEKDFQDTLNMFAKYQGYANTIIKNISFGSTLGILPGTPLYNNAKEYNIELDKFENNWVANDNPTLTLTKRIQRVKLAMQYTKELGYITSQKANEHILQTLDNNLEMFNKRLTIKKMIKIKNEKRV